VTDRLKKIFCIIIPFCLLSCTVNHDDPAAVALAYVESVYRADLRTFKQCVEEKDLQKTEDHKLFVTGKSTAKSKTSYKRGGYTSITVKSQRQTKLTATVTIDVKFAKGVTKNLRISLHKTKEGWYVNPMSWGLW